MRYKTSDFTPVYGPNMKPAIAGWYPCAVAEDSVTAMHRFAAFHDFVNPFQFFNGKEWEGWWGYQELYWFGLNKETP